MRTWRKYSINKETLSKIKIRFQDKIERFEQNKINFDIPRFFDEIRKYLKDELSHQIEYSNFQMLKILTNIKNNNNKLSKQWTQEEDKDLMKSIDK